MINHVVLMKFNSDVEDSDIKDLESSLNSLPDTIVEIHTYEFGRDVARSERSYDFALVSLFANLPALKRYQNHPDHLKVLEKLKKLCQNIITADFEVSLQVDATDSIPFSELPNL